MDITKSILILKPGIESNAANVDASEHDSEPDAVELFKRDARMHICKCKHEENRNKILRNRLIIRKQSKMNPYLYDIVKRYDDYYENFKNKIIMQIEALERLLKYLKNLEASNSNVRTGDSHYHKHNHYHYDDAGARHERHDSDHDDHEEHEDHEDHEEHEDHEDHEDELSSSYSNSVKRKIPNSIVAGIKRDQKMIFKEIRNLKNILQMKGSKREAKYKELSKYIDKIDGETNQTDNNLFKIKREQEQILETLGKITKDVKQSDKL
jgi:hypothetical protein